VGITRAAHRASVAGHPAERYQCFLVEGTLGECTSLPPGSDGSHFLRIGLLHTEVRASECPSAELLPLHNWPIDEIERLETMGAFYLSALSHACAEVPARVRAKSVRISCCGEGGFDAACRLSAPLLMLDSAEGRDRRIDMPESSREFEATRAEADEPG
jgi:hypothetical protein